MDQLMDNYLYPPIINVETGTDHDYCTTYKINGGKVGFSEFPGFSSENGKVYVDGSCYEGTWKTLARSGSAMCQINHSRDPWYSISVQFPTPKDYPQSASIGEHMAAARTAGHTSGEPVGLIADCSSVLSVFNAHTTIKYHHKNPMAGIWRNHDLTKTNTISKVKSTPRRARR